MEDPQETHDPLDGLEQRLQNHAKAFESLLALTPAREYFGSQVVDGHEPSEQWNRKKQTKEEKRAAKKAKLDPANQKSALDVLKERERKRKREISGGEEDGDGAVEPDDPAEPSRSKKQKVEPLSAADEEAKRKAKAERKKEKRTVKKEKALRKKAKMEAKKAAKQELHLEEAAEGETDNAPDPDVVMDDEPHQELSVAQDSDFDGFDASGLAEVDYKEEAPSGVEDIGHLATATSNGDHGAQETDVIHDETAGMTSSAAINGDDDVAQDSSAPTSPVGDSPAFDLATNHSTASSSTSVLAPSLPEHQPPPPALPIDTQRPFPQVRDIITKRTQSPSAASSPRLVLPDIDQAVLQERLRARIEALRTARKADGPDGQPARSRQELLDQRRKKEEQRKQTKKEQRRLAKEEELRKREAQLRSGSGSPGGMFSPRGVSHAAEGGETNNFSFSRLAFQDGSTADPTLTSLNSARKTKGPQDPGTALEAAKKKVARLAGLDATKREAIGEKDMWLRAKQRAHGERVRDDVGMLAKTLKRKEKGKGKSEREWKEREEGVLKGQEMRVKKREGNLAKRMEEKGKGKKGGSAGKESGGKGKGKGAGKGKKAQGRPGFEGRFKA